MHTLLAELSFQFFNFLDDFIFILRVYCPWTFYWFPYPNVWLTFLQNFSPNSGLAAMSFAEVLTLLFLSFGLKFLLFAPLHVNHDNTSEILYWISYCCLLCSSNLCLYLTSLSMAHLIFDYSDFICSAYFFFSSIFFWKAVRILLRAS
jgi:hypothetical protein